MPSPTAGRDGEIDAAVLRSYTKHLVNNGVHGLLPCGSIGEFSSLTREQRRTVVETVTDVAGDTPVLAGCGDTSVSAVQRCIDDAADAGAAGAVVVTPYYLDTTSDGLREFFETIADASQLPILLYNIPALTGQCISVESVVSLAQHETIKGLKDTSGNMTYHRDVIEATSEDFCVFQGSTALSVASLDIGCDGIIAGPANVFPQALSELFEAYRAGNRDRAVELLKDVVNPIVSASNTIPTAAAIKYLVGLSGIDVGEPLPPLPRLTARERERLRAAYETVRESTTVTSVS